MPWLPYPKNLGVITSGLAAATRFTMAVLFVDIEITLPAQVMMSFSEIWKAWQRDPGTVSCLQKIWVKKNEANFSGFSFGEVSLRSFLTFPFSFECLQVILFLPYELLVGSCILAVSGLVESSMRRRMATLLNSESMLTSFRQKLG